MKNVLNTYDEEKVLLSFRFNELRLFKEIPGKFLIEWQRGSTKIISNQFSADDQNVIKFDLEYQCNCTIYSSKKEKKAKAKILKILIHRIESSKKMKLFGKLNFDVSPLLGKKGFTRVESELLTGRSTHPVLVAEYKLEKFSDLNMDEPNFEDKTDDMVSQNEDWDKTDGSLPVVEPEKGRIKHSSESKKKDKKKNDGEKPRSHSFSIKGMLSKTTEFEILSFRFIELRVFRSLPGLFQIEWKRGKNQDISDLFPMNDAFVVPFNLNYQCQISIFFKSNKSLKEKPMTISVYRQEGKQKKRLLGSIKIDVAEFYNQQTSVTKEYTLDSTRSVKPVLISEFHIGKPQEGDKIFSDPSPGNDSSEEDTKGDQLDWDRTDAAEEGHMKRRGSLENLQNQKERSKSVRQALMSDLISLPNKKHSKLEAVSSPIPASKSQKRSSIVEEDYEEEYEEQESDHTQSLDYSNLEIPRVQERSIDFDEFDKSIPYVVKEPIVGQEKIAVQEKKGTEVEGSPLLPIMMIGGIAFFVILVILLK